jgi:hypothetical protein
MYLCRYLAEQRAHSISGIPGNWQEQLLLACGDGMTKLPYGLLIPDPVLSDHPPKAIIRRTSVQGPFTRPAKAAAVAAPEAR